MKKISILLALLSSTLLAQGEPDEREPQIPAEELLNLTELELSLLLGHSNLAASSPMATSAQPFFPRQPVEGGLQFGNYHNLLQFPLSQNDNQNLD